VSKEDLSEEEDGELRPADKETTPWISRAKASEKCFRKVEKEVQRP
jgi:hypothetical protein